MPSSRPTCCRRRAAWPASAASTPRCTKAVAATTPAAVAPQAVGALAFVKSHGGSRWSRRRRSSASAGAQRRPCCSPPAARTSPRAWPSIRIRSCRCRRWRRRRRRCSRSSPATIPRRTTRPSASRRSTVGGPHAARREGVCRHGARLSRSGRDEDLQADAAKQAWAAAIEHLDAHAKKASRLAPERRQASQRLGQREVRSMARADVRRVDRGGRLRRDMDVAGSRRSGPRNARRCGTRSSPPSRRPRARRPTRCRARAATRRTSTAATAADRVRSWPGNAFTKKWELQTLNQLYSEIKTRMPRNQPASLTSEEYLNLVAYILQANKFPAGEQRSDGRYRDPHVHVHRARGVEGGGRAAADHHRHAHAGGRMPAARGRAAGR